jgi:hypothetical protein
VPSSAEAQYCTITKGDIEKDKVLLEMTKKEKKIKC